ncbi:hypothetical protein FT688_14355 [Aeromonas hydrophila]|nr:hypothetical protein FT688_14355 [Aeromonas hydrophila]
MELRAGGQRHRRCPGCRSAAHRAVHREPERWLDHHGHHHHHRHRRCPGHLRRHRRGHRGGSNPVTGTLTASDADNPGLTFVAGNESRDYGRFEVGADGKWSFVLADNATVDALAAGQQHTEQFTVSLSDGSTTTVTITITGTDDAPVISADTGAVTEGDQTRSPAP